MEFVYGSSIALPRFYSVHIAVQASSISGLKSTFTEAALRLRIRCMFISLTVSAPESVDCFEQLARQVVLTARDVNAKTFEFGFSFIPSVVHIKRLEVSRTPRARAVNAKQVPPRENSFVVDTFGERHFTIAEIAEMWRISREKARRLFHSEPGVICFHGPENNGREYNTYRIPETVARRVRLRLMNL